MIASRALPLVALLSIAACGGGETPPPPATPKAPPSPAATAASSGPAAKELTCKEAIAKAHAETEARCKGECERGDGAICFAIADVEAGRDAPDEKKVTTYLGEACDHHHESSCVRLYELLEPTDPARAVSTLERGCPAEPKTDDAKRACRTLGNARRKAGTVEGLKLAVEALDRACKAEDAAACRERASTERELAQKSAPPPEEGSVVSAKGKLVVVKLAQKGDLAQGDEVRVERFFEAKKGQASPLGALAALVGNFQGWVGVAEAKVDKVQGEVVTLSVERELSNMKVNGKKVNHLTPKAPIRVSKSQGR